MQTTQPSLFDQATPPRIATRREIADRDYRERTAACDCCRRAAFFPISGWFDENCEDCRVRWVSNLPEHIADQQFPEFVIRARRVRTERAEWMEKHLQAA